VPVFVAFAVPLSLCVRSVACAWNQSKARAPILQPIIHWCLLVLCLEPLRVLHGAMTYNWRLPYDFPFEGTVEVTVVAGLLMVTMLFDMSFGRLPSILPRAVARHRCEDRAKR
jgi:hypothetical protein